MAQYLHTVYMIIYEFPGTSIVVCFGGIAIYCLFIRILNHLRLLTKVKFLQSARYLFVVLKRRLSCNTFSSFIDPFHSRSFYSLSFFHQEHALLAYNYWSAIQKLGKIKTRSTLNYSPSNSLYHTVLCDCVELINSAHTSSILGSNYMRIPSASVPIEEFLESYLVYLEAQKKFLSLLPKDLLEFLSEIKSMPVEDSSAVLERASHSRSRTRASPIVRWPATRSSVGDIEMAPTGSSYTPLYDTPL